jgi:hypothetical protein
MNNQELAKVLIHKFSRKLAVLELKAINRKLTASESRCKRDLQAIKRNLSKV